jgi:hypothetical protein
VGLALTLVPVVALNPVAGVQVYVEAPPAVKLIDAPLHIAPLFTLIVGSGFTVTVDVVEAVHPFAAVPVTVYTVVMVFVAVTEAPVVALSPVTGDQVYVDAPDADNAKAIEPHLAPEFTITVGMGSTVTIAVAVSVQPMALDPTIVYVVETVGLAVTDIPVLALNEDEGDHVYV